MRRFLRILLNAATVASLVLCVATVALWVRSYWAADQVYHLRAAKAQYFGTEFVLAWRGRLIFQSGRLDEPAGYPDDAKPNRLGYQSISLQAVQDPAKARGVGTWAGFGWGRYPYSLGLGPSGTMRVAVVPLYCVTFVLSVPAITWVRERLKKRRAERLAGHCPKCGYDLRATPERCPECGTIPAR